MRISGKASLLFAVGALFTGPGLAATVGLTSATSGTTQFNQSFNNETREIDVTVLGSSDLVVTPMTLSTLDAPANPTTCRGEDLYQRRSAARLGNYRDQREGTATYHSAHLGHAERRAELPDLLF